MTGSVRADVLRNREAIVSGAARALAVQPAASMREIAETSGISRTTLYRHFADREALVHAILGRVYDEAAVIVADGLGGAERGTDPVTAVAAVCVRLAALGDRYRFLGQAGSSRDAAPDVSRDAERQLRTFLLDQQAAGAVRRDLDADWLVEALEALVTIAAEASVDGRDRGPALEATVRSVLAPG